MIMAPAAPIAPAWLTVATPGDDRAKNHEDQGQRRHQNQRADAHEEAHPITCRLRTAPTAPSSGRSEREIRMNSIYRPTRTSPGTSAPRNISPALVETTPNSDGIEKLPVVSL